MAIENKKVIDQKAIKDMVKKGITSFQGKAKKYPLANGKGLLVTKIEVKVDNPNDLYAVIHTAQGNTQKDYCKANSAKRQVLKYRKINKAKLPKIKDVEIKLIVDIIIATGIRPGSQSENSKGLLDLVCKDVKQSKNILTLNFTGKAGVKHSIALNGLSKRLWLHIKDLKPADKIFSHTSAQVNKHLGKLNMKDFRTKLANNIANRLMKEIKLPATKKEYKEALEYLTSEVAKQLGHKKGNGDLNLGTSKKSYINPMVFQKLSSKVDNMEKILTKKEREVALKGSSWEKALLPVNVKLCDKVKLKGKKRIKK